MTLSLAELAVKVEARCVLRDREYKLSSGKKSPYYYDGKRALLAADLKILIAQAMLDCAHGLEYDIVGGVAIGSVLLSEQMSLLAQLRDGTDIDTFYVRTEKKEHGTQEDLYQARRPDGSAVLERNVRVLLVDDVVTTGTSIKAALDAVHEAQATVAAVLVVVDRQAADADWLRSDYEFRTLFTADANGKLSPSKRPALV